MHLFCCVSPLRITSENFSIIASPLHYTSAARRVCLFMIRHTGVEHIHPTPTHIPRPPRRFISHRIRIFLTAHRWIYFMPSIVPSICLLLVFFGTPPADVITISMNKFIKMPTEPISVRCYRQNISTGQTWCKNWDMIIHLCNENKPESCRCIIDDNAGAFSWARPQTTLVCEQILLILFLSLSLILFLLLSRYTVYHRQIVRWKRYKGGVLNHKKKSRYISFKFRLNYASSLAVLFIKERFSYSRSKKTHCFECPISDLTSKCCAPNEIRPS